MKHLILDPVWGAKIDDCVRTGFAIIKNFKYDFVSFEFNGEQVNISKYYSPESVLENYLNKKLDLTI